MRAGGNLKNSSIAFFWQDSNAVRLFSSAVCLHGHTMHSEECLSFLPRYLKLYSRSFAAGQRLPADVTRWISHALTGRPLSPRLPRCVSNRSRSWISGCAQWFRSPTTTVSKRQWPYRLRRTARKSLYRWNGQCPTNGPSCIWGFTICRRRKPGRGCPSWRSTRRLLTKRVFLDPERVIFDPGPVDRSQSSVLAGGRSRGGGPRGRGRPFVARVCRVFSRVRAERHQEVARERGNHGTGAQRTRVR